MAFWNPFKKDKPAELKVAESESTEANETGQLTEAEQPIEAEQPTKSKGLFGGIKNMFTSAVEVFKTDIRDLTKSGRLVDDDFLDELFAILVKTDMGNAAASEIRDDVGKKFRARKLELADLIASVKETVSAIMGQDQDDLILADSGPTVIMVVGVNGSGKTTSIAKLAHLFIDRGKSVVLGAGDTFRAAAVGQLTIWAERLGADLSLIHI